MLCSSQEDEPRYPELIEEWISKEEVPPFLAFVGETRAKKKARKRKREAEAKEAEEALKEMGAQSSMYTITNLITCNESDLFIDQPFCPL